MKLDVTNNLKVLDAKAVVHSALNAVKVEKASTLEVIRHFEEIELRRIYLEYGYSSLFLMATDYFGYCAQSAQRRINAMRLLVAVPEITAHIESGELKLTVAADIQLFLQLEKKNENEYSRTEKFELSEMCLGKSTREVQKELASRNPDVTKTESVKYVSGDRLKMTITISEKLLEKLEACRAKHSHVKLNMTFEELIERLVDQDLKPPTPRKTKSQEKPLPAREVKRSRYIPARIDRVVKRANQNQGCEFTSEKSGHRCEAKTLLQRDHIHEFAKGGAHDPENLRLLCAQHNRFIYKQRRVDKRGFRVPPAASAIQIDKPATPRHT